jgi:hypothetical protein
LNWIAVYDLARLKVRVRRPPVSRYQRESLALHFLRDWGAWDKDVPPNPVTLHRYRREVSGAYPYRRWFAAFVLGPEEIS